VIDFTADWCPNCRLVENITLKDEKVARVLGEGNIDFMIADITTKNDVAEYLMSQLRSQSILLLAIIPPGSSFTKPVVLRDIYSVQDVLTALEIARDRAQPEPGGNQVGIPDPLLKE